MSEVDQYIQQRKEKAAQLRKMGLNPYPNGICPKDTVADIVASYGVKSAEELETTKDKKFSIAGRIIAFRSFGKAAFLKLRDRTGDFQVFVQKQLIGDEQFELFKLFDIGDIVWFEGYLFRTKTNELTLASEKLKIVNKTLKQLPEKWHGLTDVEARYRQRYVDMIANPEVKNVFVKRSKIIKEIRDFFENKGFLEVETPMMHPIPGGAAAKPFVTHHNKLNRDLYLRIAPELYLKRLLVGGIEKVFEINRNFRNEGISIQHNPEFTMCEFYQTYATYEDLIKLTEELISTIAKKILGKTKITYQGVEIDLTPPFKCYKMTDAIVDIGKLPHKVLESKEAALKHALEAGIELKKKDEGHGAILAEIFECEVEEKLIQPTFITHYPTEISPLSRLNEKDPFFVDRFELFIFGREIANAFSELNDSEDQANRFKKQVEALGRGDEEAMHYDEDFINALEYGMPPAAGEGIGIDRLVMLLTDSASIRDVILFPQLKSKE